MSDPDVAELLKLPAEEKLRLLELLWESLSASASALPWVTLTARRLTGPWPNILERRTTF